MTTLTIGGVAVNVPVAPTQQAQAVFKELEEKFGLLPEATKYLTDTIKVTSLDDFVDLFATSSDVQAVVDKMGLASSGRTQTLPHSGSPILNSSPLRRCTHLQ